MDFNKTIKILGGNFYKIFWMKIENSFNLNDLEVGDFFGLLIESKKKRQFLSNIGQVSGWDGLFLCEKKIDTNINSAYLVKYDLERNINEVKQKRVVYQLDYDYYAVDDKNMAPLLKQYNHCSYKIKEVAIPEIIDMFYIEEEVLDIEGKEQFSRVEAR